MNNPRDMNAHGPFEARYMAFLETIALFSPRPRLAGNLSLRT